MTEEDPDTARVDRAAGSAARRSRSDGVRVVEGTRDDDARHESAQGTDDGTHADADADAAADAGGRRGPSADVDGDEAPIGSAWAQLVFAVAAVAIGVVLVQQASTIESGLSPAGPRFVPTCVGVGWLVLALAYTAGILTRLVRHHPPVAAERLDRLPRVVALLLVLVAYAYLLEPVGYLLSTSVFLAVAAAILGSRSHLRDAAIAVVLAVLLYFLFSRSLGIFLPAGVIPL